MAEKPAEVVEEVPGIMVVVATLIEEVAVVLEAGPIAKLTATKSVVIRHIPFG